ncbi:diacylglycerol kinase [Altericroceibacterium spongiae]|uniref:Diacylglycerol kinase n=1 Tax=Altericroceibacterium spongiae TaxID=2320269 RepID=A0A420EP75_9SPHN|nr:diacylglycerol kinase family protein [Altericroceibacterium spongiae]RKF22472.1 diacylglycerol kinase [Altericroceibacterium spongiae]
MGSQPSSLARKAAISGSVDDSPDRLAQPVRIGAIHNPRSHRNKKAGPLTVADQAVMTVIPETQGELDDALVRFAREKVDYLAIDGGDGTIRDVLTRGARSFGDNWPDLIILPNGKTNALAVDLGVPAGTTLADAIEAIALGGLQNRITRHPLLLEKADGTGSQHIGFLFGAGAFNAAIETGQMAHRFGAFQSFAIGVTAAAGLAQALFGIGKGGWRQLAPMRIRDDDKGTEVPHSGHVAADLRYFAGFSTLERFPLGMEPFGKNSSGLRYLVIDAPLRKVILRLPALLMGMEGPKLPRLGVHRGKGESFDLELGGKFILDGEAFEPGHYRLRLGPELRFIVP